jgi:predicted metal-dependent peptidase
MRAKKLFSPTDDLSSVKCYIASLLILQSKAPVHYSVVIATEVIWTDALPTAGTDGVYVYVNPSFFRGLGSDSQRAFLLAHEASHIIMRHPMRGKMYKDRGAFVGGLRWDHGTYNLAADYIINSDCISMGFEPIPQGCYSEQYGRDDLTDNVYAELLGNQSEPPEPPKGEDEGGEEGSGEEGGDPAPRDDEGDGDDDSDSGSGGGSGDDKSDGESGEGGSGGSGDAGESDDAGAPQPTSPRQGHDDHFEPQYDGNADEQRADQEQDQHDLGSAIDDGLDEAERMGRSSSGQVAEQGNRFQAGNASDVSWQEELQELLRRIGSGGKVTWSQINRRRFVTMGVVSPERRGELNRISVIVDISGSVCRNQIQAFMVELASAIDELQPSDGALIIFTNHEYHSHAEVYSGGELLDIEIPSGGGTFMSEGLRWLESTGLESDVILCFTDGDLYHSDWQYLGDNDVIVVSDRVLYACDQRNADRANVKVIVAAAA